MAIIGISGKKQSGKDTVAKIIQYLTTRSLENHISEEGERTFNMYVDSFAILRSSWEIIRFADKIKDIVCLLIGCTREQLEDEEFKNTELGEEWIRYGYANGFSHVYRGGDKETIMNNEPCSKERYEQERITNWQTAYKTVLTPRLLLQLIGTDVGRVIHPNTWINVTMKDYKLITSVGIILDHSNPDNKTNKKYVGEETLLEVPDWLIPDTRFPNELKAIEDRGGFVIRVNRPDNNIHKNDKLEHISEKSLDNHTFKYTIDNNGTIEDLILKVKEILINEKII